jgi:hypothetical protein
MNNSLFPSTVSILILMFVRLSDRRARELPEGVHVRSEWSLNPNKFHVPITFNLERQWPNWTPT